MTTSRSVLIAAMLSAGFTTGADSACETALSTAFYDQKKTTLAAQGCTCMRSLSADGSRIAAFDADGSEVLILSNADSEEILSVRCVHSGDE